MRRNRLRSQSPCLMRHLCVWSALHAYRSNAARSLSILSIKTLSLQFLICSSPFSSFVCPTEKKIDQWKLTKQRKHNELKQFFNAYLPPINFFKASRASCIKQTFINTPHFTSQAGAQSVPENTTWVIKGMFYCQSFTVKSAQRFQPWTDLVLW